MKRFTGNTFSGQKGFTLIELVVVIVILGILAATAAPKFIDLTGDAKASVMRGVEASIESVSSVMHAKAIIDGKTSGTSTAAAYGLKDLLELDTTATGDFKITESSTTTIIQHISASSADCRLVYTRSSGVNIRPVIDSTSLDDC